MKPYWARYLLPVLSATVLLLASLAVHAGAYQAALLWQTRIDVSLYAEHATAVCGSGGRVYVVGYLDTSSGYEPFIAALDARTGKLLSYDIRTAEDGSYTSCAATTDYVIVVGSVNANPVIRLYRASDLELLGSTRLDHVSYPDRVLTIGGYAYVIGTDYRGRLAIEKHVVSRFLQYSGHHTTTTYVDEVLDAKYDPAYGTIWVIANSTYSGNHLVGFTTDLISNTYKSTKACRLQPLPGVLALLSGDTLQLVDKSSFKIIATQSVPDAYCLSYLAFLYPYGNSVLLVASPHRYYTRLIAYMLLDNNVPIPYINSRIPHATAIKYAAHSTYVDIYEGNVYFAYTATGAAPHSGAVYVLAVHVPAPGGRERTVTVRTTETKTVTTTKTAKEYRTVYHTVTLTTTYTKTVTRTRYLAKSYTTTKTVHVTHWLTRTATLTRTRTLTTTLPVTATTTVTRNIYHSTTVVSTTTLTKTVTVGAQGGSSQYQPLIVVAGVSIAAILVLLVRP